MVDTLHPQALKTLRNKKGLSQEELAGRIGVTPGQISRWECGKSVSLRKRSRAALTKALGVTWDELTREPSGDIEDYQLRQTAKLSLHVKRETRTALEIVALLYGVRWSDIVDLAPLLFLIMAEGSLAYRSKRVDEIEKDLDELVQKSQESLPHLAPAFDGFRSHDAGIELSAERESIKARQVFGVDNPYDIDNNNPFANYLDHFLGDVRGRLIEDIFPRWMGDAPSWSFTDKLLSAVTEIQGDTEQDRDALRYVANGDIDLRILREKRKSATEQEFELWLRTEIERAKAESQAALSRLLEV